jgi:mycofactocin biosynthetic radical S-adenosylmethionine protein MftC
MTATLPVGRLVDQFELGLDAPICLTWELTYACNLSCIHCLSSSGKRDPNELSTEQCKAVIDELERMQVFYVNIGGGEPTVRSDFWELIDYATAHHVGVKFSTNGVRLDKKGRSAAGRVGLRRRADLPRRRDRGSQRRRAR